MTKGLFASTLGLLGGRLTLPFFSFLLFFVTARMLTIGDFGLYILLTGWISLFQGLSTLGLGQLLSREIGQRPEEEGLAVSSALAIALPASVIAYFAFLLMASFLKDDGEFLLLAAIIALSLPLSTIMFVTEAVFVVRGTGTRLLYLGLIEQSARVALSVAALFRGYGLYGLAGAFVLSRLVGVACSAYYYFRHEGRPPLQLDRGHARRICGQLKSFAPIMILGLLLFRADTVTLGWLLTDEEMGLYGCAARIVTLTFIAPESVIAAHFPQISRQWARNDPHFVDKTTAATELLVAVGVAGALAMAACGPFTVPAVFGAKFAESIPLLAVMGFLLPSHTMEAQVGTLYQAIGREKTNVLLLCLSLPPFFGFIAAGAVLWGLHGAAVGFVAASWLMGAIGARSLPPSVLSLRGNSPLVRVAGLLVVTVAPLLIWRPESDLSYCLLLAAAALTALVGSGMITKLNPRQIRTILS